MKNEIKKIIISIENKKQIGITVVRENSIERYGYGKHSDEKQFDIYNKVYSELKRQYKSELIGLTETQIANRLRSKFKVIEYSDEKLIENVKVYLNKNSEIEEFTIQYVNGDIETKSINDSYDLEQIDIDYDMTLLKLCHIYGIELNTVDDLDYAIIEKLESLKLVKMTKKKNKKNEIDVRNSDSTEENNEESRDDVSLTSKVKNFIMNHKIISGILLTETIILITTIPGCSRKSNSKNVVAVPTVTLYVDETKEPVVTDYYSSDEEPVSVIEQEPTIKPLNFFKEIYINGEEQLFENYVEPESDTLIMKDIDGGIYYLGDNSFDFNLENLNMIRNETMSNVGNYVQGGFDIGDTGRYIYFENMFNNSDNKDKAYVKYFSMIGNSLVKSVYEDNNEYNLTRYLKLSGYEVIRLIRDNEPLCVYINGNEEWVSFSDLSYDAQETVLNIAWTSNLPLNINIISYSNGQYNQDDISDIILEKYNSLQKVKSL